MNRFFDAKYLIPIGFSILLVFITIQTVVETLHLTKIYTHTKKIVYENNAKTEYATTMYNASRDRAIKLHQMIMLSDPFARDQAYIEFQSLAGDFIKARNALSAMELNEQEKNSLDRILTFSSRAAIAQEHASELLLENKTSEIHSLMENDVFPAQQVVRDALNYLIQLQREANRRAEHEALAEEQQAKLLIISLGGLLLCFCLWMLGQVLRVLRQDKQALAQAEARAVAAERVKEEFLANLSHEIRTPLNSILGMTQILSETPLPAEYIEIVNATHSTGVQFLRLMDDILALAQLESGEFCLAQQSFVLRDGLDEVLQQSSGKATSKGLNFNLFFDERNPDKVQGDMRRIQQIFEHLLDNAIKFTEKGEITVSVSSQLNNLQQVTLDCMVKDTGCGIPSAQIGSLFQAFSKTHAVQGGTGVGLALCQRLCQRMGGTLWVESVEGEGSTFYFTLKLQQVYVENLSQAVIEHPLVLNTPDLNAVQVLVVEDNTMSQKVATLILKRMGYHADVVNNGLEAIRALETKRYDVLLMDVRMPELDGLETTRRILERWKAPNTPYIIAMTANVQPEARSQCLAMGMNDYLSKPVHVDELEAAFMRWRARVGSR
ncbi:MAG: hypothetical protein RIS84_1917 [Pseudomonadota bacterium]